MNELWSRLEAPPPPNLPAVEELDGWVPIHIVKDRLEVAASKTEGENELVQNFPAEGKWRIVYDYLLERQEIITKLDRELRKEEPYMLLPEHTKITLKMTPPIPSKAGGKRRQVTFLKELVPEHDLYVEPFAGGAALFFMLPPGTKAVLNDISPRFTKIWQWIKQATPKQVEAMQARKWDAASKEEWLNIIDNYKPKTLDDEVWKTLYVVRHSFMNQGTRENWRGEDAANPGDHARNRMPTWINRVPQYQQQLANAQIEQKDWKEVVREHDGPGTFFYIDPPYEEKFARELPSVLAQTEGKWLLSFGDDPQLAKDLQQQGFQVHHANITNTINRNPDRWLTRTGRREILAANYPINVPEGLTFKWVNPDVSLKVIFFSTVTKDVGDYSRATKAWKQAASVDDRLSKALDSIFDRAKARQLTQPEAVNEAHALIEQAFVEVKQVTEERVSRMARKQVPLAPEMTARLLRMKAEKMEEAEIIIKDIYLTEFEKEGKKYAGADVEAESFDEAAQTLKDSKIVGELKKRVPLDSE